MDKNTVCNLAEKYTMENDGNYIKKEYALSPELIGEKMFEPPVIKFGGADDSLYECLKKPGVVGEHLLLPSEWLPEAKTVICFFFPFTRAVKDSNKNDPLFPSYLWLHARIEGQKFIAGFSQFLTDQLVTNGFKSVSPLLDNRFLSTIRTIPENLPAEKIISENFTSNWSERHAAYLSGLGTFSLSKGFITEKGMAGRLGSVITAMECTPDPIPYNDIYEYCSLCGACIKKCPANAISLDFGKNHNSCALYLHAMSEKYKPRYGCGKCQVNVPCQDRVPRRL